MATKDLLDEERAVFIYLNLTTKKFISEHKRLKPVRLSLVHPITSQHTSICLICKDPQRQFKDLVEAAHMQDIVTRVIGVSKFKGKFKAYEARRQLRDQHDLFVADSRVSPLLPKLLGKIYISKKKLPLPIEVTENSTPQHLKSEIKKAMNSTLLHLSPGTCTSIRIASSQFTAEQIADNIELVVNALTKTWIPEGWRGVRGFHLKTSESTSLPIWLIPELKTDGDEKVKETQK